MFTCKNCLHPGVRIERRQTYPYGEYELRTSDLVAEHAQEADAAGKPVSFSFSPVARDRPSFTKCFAFIFKVFGVKCKALISDIVQVPEDVPVDYMHAVLEGKM